jgi:putative transposase
MGQTYTSLYVHIIFSTKNREPVLHDGLREKLWAYIGGIARKEEVVAMGVGGTNDHIHALLSTGPTVAAAKITQTIKTNSSKWINETAQVRRRFAWQEGYGAFSVSYSQIDRTLAYIQNQAKHHRRKSFQEEYLKFLVKHKVKYDERYIWE